MSSTIDSLADQFPEVRELLTAYENCLEQIGNDRHELEGLEALKQIATSLQNNINVLIPMLEAQEKELQVLRPLLDMGLQTRQAQMSYYSEKRRAAGRLLNEQQRAAIDKVAREWLIASKVNEKELDRLLAIAVEHRDRTKPKPPPEPEQGELL